MWKLGDYFRLKYEKYGASENADDSGDFSSLKYVINY
jgi:hypothetical protein